MVSRCFIYSAEKIFIECQNTRNQIIWTLIDCQRRKAYVIEASNEKMTYRFIRSHSAWQYKGRDINALIDQIAKGTDMINNRKHKLNFFCHIVKCS